MGTGNTNIELGAEAMIELKDNSLSFNFPEVHKDARCNIEFQRTLRIPDDNQEYSLPPGLGMFPLSHVDDYSGKVPEAWTTHGGVFLPMYQAEAMWINFNGDYPFAIKIAAGKINAVTGDLWSNALSVAPDDAHPISRHLIDSCWASGRCFSARAVLSR
jgi:hypothetical protein